MSIAVSHSLLVDIEPDNLDSALKFDRRQASAVMGETVQGFLDRHGWIFELPTVCRIGDEYYSRSEWLTRVIGYDDRVEFLSRPLGGGGGSSSAKSIGAILALVALTVLAPYAMAAIGLTGAAAQIGTALIIGAGSLLISHFLKPKAGAKTSETDDLYSFGFGGNAARPLQPIPVGYGRTLSFPDYAAPSYSEYHGDSMSEHALLSLGCGRYDIEEVRISDTTIWTKNGGYNPSFPGIALQFVEPGANVDLFPVNVVTSSEVSSLELTTDFTPGYTVNAATTRATELIFDFVWPSGCYSTRQDKNYPLPVHILIEAQPVDDGGAPAGVWFTLHSRVFEFNKQSQIRVTERVPVPPARYNVRVRRVNAPVAGTTWGNGKVTGIDDVVWAAVRARIEAPQSYPRVTTVAIRAEANSAMQGVTNGQLGIVATRILPVWENGEFVEKPTRSIAWAALDMWRNSDYAAGLPLSQIDLQSFIAYDELWAGLGHTFDTVFKEPTSLDEVLETIFKAGRAMPVMIGDRLSVVRDEPRGLPRMLFTDMDIVKDSLSINYVMADPEYADGVIGEYLDGQTFKLAQITSAPGGTRLAKPAEVQLAGVSNRAQAAGLVRFMAAESLYRRIHVSWTARLEGRLLKRGDLVKLCCELPETWGQTAELVSFDEATRRIVFDRDMEWDSEALNHYIEVRRRDGAPWGPVRLTRGATARTGFVNGADLESEAIRQGMTLADAVARSDTMDLPTVAFSPGQPRTFRVLITEGDPDDDNEHIHLTGVVDNETVYDVTETGIDPLPDIPDAWSSSIPVITSLGAQVFQRQTDIILSAGWSPPRGAVSYVADVSYDDLATWVPAYSGDKTSFEVKIAGAERVYVRVSAVTAANVRGAWAIGGPYTPPNLTVSDEYVYIHIKPDDLEPSLGRSISMLPYMISAADLAAESRVIAEEADELGRAAIEQIAVVKLDVDGAYAALGSKVITDFLQNGATVSDMMEALATADTAQAQRTDIIEAHAGELSAAVELQATAIAGINTGLQAAYTVKLNAGDFWSGFQMVQTDGTAGPVSSEFRIATDKFFIGAPNGDGEVENVFTVATVGGQARVAIRGDLISDGTISAAALQVQSLSAISGNMGTLTAGVISLSGGSGRLEVWD